MRQDASLPDVEALEIIIEGLIWLLDGGTLIADLYSIWKGRKNRAERREARKAGNLLPPRDKWNHLAIVFTLIFAALTTALVLSKY